MGEEKRWHDDASLIATLKFGSSTLESQIFNLQAMYKQGFVTNNKILSSL